MLLRGSVRTLEGLLVSRPLVSFQKHAPSQRSLCTQSLPRTFERALSSAFLFPIWLPRSCRGLLRSASPQSQSRVQTRLRMGWACAGCSFINVARSACGVCSEPAPGASSTGDAEWTCEACTFVNIGEAVFCEMCDNGRSTLGVSVLGTSFRPLRASAKVEPSSGRVEEDVPVMKVESPECIVTGGTRSGDECPNVASGSKNPKSRKRKAKEAEVIDLSDSKSGDDVSDGKDSKKNKENGEEPNHLLKNLHKERMSRMQGGTSAVVGMSPLRPSAKLEQEVGRGEEGEAVAKVKSLEAECIVAGNTWSGDEGSKAASGSKKVKSRKRKTKVADVIDLSDSKSGEDAVDAKAGKKENGEEPNNLLKNLHRERMSRMQGGISAVDSSDVNRENYAISSSPGASDVEKGKGVISLSALSREQKLAYIEAEGTWLEKPSAEVIVLSYNVWFREDLELEARLDAIGDVILQHRPHIVFFQEVTETIYKIFQQASWWKSYDCSVKPGVRAQRAYFCMQLSKLPVVSFRQSPFRNSVMGRELCLAELDSGKGVRLFVATSHLESPCPAPPTWNQMFSPERVVQAKEAMSLLNDFPNVIFGGDMNWDDKKDGPPPLPSDWFDAWLHLHPGRDGFTYDTKANKMLSGNRSLQKRLDRMFCRLGDFEAVSIEMVGTKPIPDLTYSKEKKVKGQVQMIKLPVLPSDHFGLLLKLCRKSV